MNYTIDDVVHGKISLPDYVVSIIETAEFQRLRNLKQLGEFIAFKSHCGTSHYQFSLSGVSNFIFASANHSRAEHCIGTAYLCKKQLEVLEKNSGKAINELYKKCIIVSAFDGFMIVTNV